MISFTGKEKIGKGFILAVLSFLFPTLYLIAFPFYREPVKSRLSLSESNLVWIFFTDKGFRTEGEYQNLLKNFSLDYPAAVIEKRLQKRGVAYDFYDLPVYQKYIDEIIALGGRLRNVSNWLNAASFEVDQSLLSKIYRLPFVYEIRPLKMNTFEVQVPERVQGEDTAPYSKLYGMSFRQIAMLGVHKAHERGIYGSNVKIGLLDTGLKRKKRNLEDTTVHSAVENIKVFKEHDFLAGSNFFQARRGNGFIPETTRLKNFRNIEDAKITYLFSNNGRDTQPGLFYIADTTYLNYPRRAVFYSLFSPSGWQSPVMISHALPNFVFHHLSFAFDKFFHTLITFEGADPDERTNTNIYFGYFQEMVLKPIEALGSGKRPFIFSFGDKVYLVFTEMDSVVKIKIAQAFPDSIVWQSTGVIASVPEKIKELTGASTKEGKVSVFALGLKTGSVYHFHSEDGGNTFTEMPSPFPANVSQIKVHSVLDTILLFAKLYSLPPLISLSYKAYSDGNWGEEKKILENLSHLGNFSFLGRDTFYLALEKDGRIHLFKSLTRGEWEKISIDTSDFLYDPQIFLVGGDIYTLWLKNGDDNTDEEIGEEITFPEQPYHGTRMASLIAGYSKGNLIGVAPGAELIVAKTERLYVKNRINYEFIVEEDNWVKGLEWAERNGADIISSSLGYRGWYTDKDFDGATCVTSIAAGIAAKRGLIIVTAMGNRGRDSLTYPWPTPYLVAPGDADGVLTVGGVNLDSTSWKGSGAGPTVDGRIKPDLVALSSNAVVACPYLNGCYEYSIGTSSATALIAGLCALVLESHPNWNIDSVKKALFSTASQSVPTNTMGWGLPNIDSLLKIYPPQLSPYKKNEIGDIFPQPFIIGAHDKIYFPIYLNNLTWIKIRIYDLRGKLIKKIESEKKVPPGRYTRKEELEAIGAYWDGKENGKECSSGLYLVLLQTGFGNSVKKFVLLR